MRPGGTRRTDGQFPNMTTTSVSRIYQNHRLGRRLEFHVHISMIEGILNSKFEFRFNVARAMLKRRGPEKEAEYAVLCTASSPPPSRILVGVEIMIILLRGPHAVRSYCSCALQAGWRERRGELNEASLSGY